ncbi:helix-turn-helix domain-containing protein [Nitrogeniibacter aestuarii]|uniref:hypothetical protein n=1 Tax=Nitrogeniibacter aestuarii TaxID=2815343 RepID=UPI001E553C05|nr:hypothetical protein [Nitrogeniibacter aestuarii]
MKESLSERFARHLSDIRAYRKQTAPNQTKFWEMVGVTQSGGCRYEQTRSLPKPVAMLLALREMGLVSAAQLLEAKALVEEVEPHLNKAVALEETRTQRDRLKIQRALKELDGLVDVPGLDEIRNKLRDGLPT